jgi:hypothetical protein
MQVYEHVLPLQFAADALTRLHLSPQAPQLLVVLSAVHVEPHMVSGHVQAPLVQSGVGWLHGAQAAPAFPHVVPDWDP